MKAIYTSAGVMLLSVSGLQSKQDRNLLIWGMKAK